MSPHGGQRLVTSTLDDVLCRNEGGAALMAAARGKLPVLEHDMRPEATTPRQMLSRMRNVALASHRAKAIA